MPELIAAKLLADLHQLHEQLNIALQYDMEDRPRVSTNQDAADLLMPFLGALDHEELWIVNLTTAMGLMNITKLYQGTLNTSQVRTAELFRQAIISNSAGIIIAHNHPSGSTSPSQEDIMMTRAAIQAGKLLEINVLDHLIFGNNQFTSLRVQGTIEF